jgi:Antibiotic biosynthesis monooxygenase
MSKFVEMDEKVTLSAQMEENIGPVILINKFNVNPEDVDQFLRKWTADAAIFKQQPGFISAQLHRGIGGSGAFLNYALASPISIPFLTVIYLPPFVAFRINCATSFGCDTGDAWLDGSEIVVALICFANIRSASGGME